MPFSTRTIRGQGTTTFNSSLYIQAAQGEDIFEDTIGLDSPNDPSLAMMEIVYQGISYIKGFPAALRYSLDSWTASFNSNMAEIEAELLLDFTTRASGVGDIVTITAVGGTTTIEDYVIFRGTAEYIFGATKYTYVPDTSVTTSNASTADTHDIIVCIKNCGADISFHNTFTSASISDVLAVLHPETSYYNKVTSTSNYFSYNPGNWTVTILDANNLREINLRWIIQLKYSTMVSS